MKNLIRQLFQRATFVKPLCAYPSDTPEDEIKWIVIPDRRYIVELWNDLRYCGFSVFWYNLRCLIQWSKD